MSEQTPATFMEVALEDTHARALLAADELAKARAILDRAGVSAHPPLLVRRAAIELHEGSHEQAESSLERVLDGDGPSIGDFHPACALEAWLLLALARHALGDEAGSSEHLTAVWRSPSASPTAMPSCWAAPRFGSSWSARPATALRTRPCSSPCSTAWARFRRRSSLREPLTEQEQRILRYLPTMLSNAEIGAEIFVSLNTVKTHLRSISASSTLPAEPTRSRRHASCTCCPQAFGVPRDAAALTLGKGTEAWRLRGQARDGGRRC